MISTRCLCGQCALLLADSQPIYSQFCGCQDCLHALQWAASKGGPLPQKLPQLLYLRSDIINVEGKQHMKPYRFDMSGQTTRVHCNDCFSLMGCDHPGYKDNVFSVFLNHCEIEHAFQTKAMAAINMSSYSSKEPAEIPSDIPVFYSFEYRQEAYRFWSIPAVKKAFSPPEKLATGQSFRELLNELGEVKPMDV